jgi:hypothetical protein
MNALSFRIGTQPFRVGELSGVFRPLRHHPASGSLQLCNSQSPSAAHGSRPWELCFLRRSPLVPGGHAHWPPSNREARCSDGLHLLLVLLPPAACVIWGTQQACCHQGSVHRCCQPPALACGRIPASSGRWERHSLVTPGPLPTRASLSQGATQ